MKLPLVILFASALVLSQAAQAEKNWNANHNPAINNWISGMYADVAGPLGALLQECQSAAAADCQVTIQAKDGVRPSRTDALDHFTVLFSGSHAQYKACHIYPQHPSNNKDKALIGANCYQAGHAPTYYKLN